MSFRDAHEVSGKVVSRAEQLGCDVTKLSLQDLQDIRYVDNNNGYAVLDMVNNRDDDDDNKSTNDYEVDVTNAILLWFDAWMLWMPPSRILFFLSWLTPSTPVIIAKSSRKTCLRSGTSCSRLNSIKQREGRVNKVSSSRFTISGSGFRKRRVSCDRF